MKIKLPSTEPPQIEMIPPPRTMGEAIHRMHQSSDKLLAAVRVLEHIAELGQQTPEFRTVIINDANNGQYQVVDRGKWPAKSIGLINVGAAPVFVGVGGVSARPGSRAPSCPGGAAMVLPVEAQDLELGCDPAVLGANSAVVYLFRYVTVQPPMLGS